MNNKIIHVNDETQQGYRYELVEEMNSNFADDFKPELSPQEMLELGVFDGAYFNSIPKEFPSSWFKHQSSSNCFGVSASQPLSEWKRKGWITEHHDPLGWFQWYCRYFMGRRLKDEDQRQIKRWKAMTRHIAQVRKNCELGNLLCRPKQRQALLHWAYDSRRI